MRRFGVVYLAVFAMLRLTLASPEGCDEPSARAMRSTAARAATWLSVNQRADGTYLYESTSDGTDLGAYNDVRHAGVMLALYRTGAIEAADRGLEWARRRLHEVPTGGLALASDRVAATGGSALLASALLERRSRTGDQSNDDLLGGLGAFLVGMQRPDGGFYVAVDVDTGTVDRTGTSRYYPGEALWALARLESVFPSEPWEGPAKRAATFIATKRDDVEGVVAPPLNDHWAAYGFAEMATWSRLDDDVAAYARKLYGRFALLIRTESRHDAAPVQPLLGPPRRAAALGTWVEGQAALARLAAIDDRLADLRSRIVASTRCGAGVLVDRQATNGAWYDAGVTRMDDEQHAISGLEATADIP